MPRGDGTGPKGAGAMTGRAAGFCAGNQVAGYMNPVGGRRGFGMGRGGDGGFGMGRGWRNQFYATGLPRWARGAYGVPVPPTITAEQELVGLKQQAEQLHDTLAGITSRIEQLETESSSKS